jgi:hypothetical protein
VRDEVGVEQGEEESKERRRARRGGGKLGMSR